MIDTARAGARDFVARFTALWAEPTPEGFAPMFHPEATIFWPGMPAPIGPDDLAAYFRGVVLPLLPDIRLTPERWLGDDEVLFIEWTITGTREGKRVAVPGVDRFLLRGDKAVAMRAYLDPGLLLSG